MGSHFIISTIVAINTVVAAAIPERVISQQFIHPGINQSAKDLEHMKHMVLEGREPEKELLPNIVYQ